MAFLDLVDKSCKLFHFLVHLLFFVGKIIDFGIGGDVKAGEPILLGVNKRVELIGFVFRNVLRVLGENVLDDVFVFVDERLELVFLFVELLDFKVPKSHLFLLFLHLGELLTWELGEVVDVGGFQGNLAVEWPDAVKF